MIEITDVQFILLFGFAHLLIGIMLGMYIRFLTFEKGKEWRIKKQ